jgi:hypothetical protein
VTFRKRLITWFGRRNRVRMAATSDESRDRRGRLKTG